MITSVHLLNFLSHRDTRVELGDGVTVFVGHNGAGKSSVIDAITFALFAKHSRKANPDLLRRGSDKGAVTVEIQTGGRQYRAVRKLARNRSSEALVSEKDGEGWKQLAAGERKQFGESSSGRIEDIIEMDFEEVKIASIVRQGELTSIINAPPKAFKELVSAIIRTDRLDDASEAMKKATAAFRESIRDRLGYDDGMIDAVSRDVSEAEDDLKECRPALRDKESQAKGLVGELKRLEGMIQEEKPKQGKIGQLERRRQELHSYVQGVRQKMLRDLQGEAARITECQRCIGPASGAEAAEAELAAAKGEHDRAQAGLEEISPKAGALRKQLEQAGQLKDGKCPVCGTKVDKLGVVSESHIKKELAAVEQKEASLKRSRGDAAGRIAELEPRLRAARDARAKLEAHGMSGKDQLDKEARDLESRKAEIPPDTADEGQMSRIDGHAGGIYAEIQELEKATAGFSESRIGELEGELDEKRREKSGLDQDIGTLKGRIKAAEQTIEKKSGIIDELRIVREYAKRLESIQANIFFRDGQVARSMRRWALDTMSVKASEYLSTFNTKIQRVRISEDKKIDIECHAGTEVLPFESLSGGEQVSVALALRLGMARLLGSSSLDLMILDEPTANLDAERKGALVEILTGLGETAGPTQFVIITHDEQIFENARVGRLVRFSSGPDGTTTEAL